MESIWRKTAGTDPFPALDREISTDVLIIGGWQTLRDFARENPNAALFCPSRSILR